eukprot:6646588-Alexandrium_andersonii.AAC.1
MDETGYLVDTSCVYCARFDLHDNASVWQAVDALVAENARVACKQTLESPEKSVWHQFRAGVVDV